MEQNYTQYLEGALNEFNSKIQSSSSGQPPLVVDRNVGLPELFRLLGTRSFEEGAASTTDAGASKEDVARFLVNVFQKNLKPSDVLSGDMRDPQLRSAAEQLLIAAAKSRGVDLQPEEATQIIQLLETGEFFNEISASTAAIIYCIPGLPIAVLSDAKGALSPRLITAVLKDVIGLVGLLTSFKAVESILEDLQDGTFDHPPKVMVNTLKELFRKATVRVALTTVHQLYAKDNQSIRLATILYARSNHVDLTNDDIDLVLGTALDPDNPDLGPALGRAFDKLPKAARGKLPI